VAKLYKGGVGRAGTNEVGFGSLCSYLGFCGGEAFVDTLVHGLSPSLDTIYHAPYHAPYHTYDQAHELTLTHRFTGRLLRDPHEPDARAFDHDLSVVQGQAWEAAEPCVALGVVSSSFFCFAFVGFRRRAGEATALL
jgi:hypothetical protein